MKYIWVLPVACFCAMSCGCKPQPLEQTAAEKKMADFVREERIREIEVTKKRIGDLIVTLADLEKNNEESEADIAYKLTGNRYANPFSEFEGKEEYMKARAKYHANKLDRAEKAKERINKELADLRIHLRSLLDLESKPTPAAK